MAEDREILKEFLVSLGYHVEPASAKRFIASLVGTEKLAVKLGGSIAGVAVAAEAMVTHFSHQMENLFYVSRRTGAAVKNIQALRFGAQQIGLTAEDATAALEGFANALRFEPGTRGLFARLTGNAPGADNEKNLIALLKSLRNMPDYLGAQYAGMFGMTPQQFLMFEQGLPDMIASGERLSAMYRTAGIDQQKAAETGREYANTLRDIWAQVGVVGDSLAIQLQGPFQQFANWIKDTLTGLAQLKLAELDFSPKNMKAVAKEVIKDIAPAGGVVQGTLEGMKDRMNILPPGYVDYSMAYFKLLASPFTGGKGPGGGTGGAITPGSFLPVPAKKSLQIVADAAADASGIPRNLFRALIGKESNWNPNADASKNDPNSHAWGLTQLQPGTARSLGVDRFDVGQNIFGGAEYLRQQLARFGNPRDALAAYHEGPGGKLSNAYGYADSILASAARMDAAGPTVFQQNNTINVTAGKDADKTARAISSELNRTTGDLIRNQAGATR